MPIRDLRAIYGHNLKGREAVNRAIRHELIGGNDCLDALDAVNQVARKLQGLPNAKLAQQALNLLRQLREAMADDIAHKYGLAGRQPDPITFGSGDGT